MSGTVAKAYKDMARGSPWVVPSSEISVMPSTNSSVGSRYILIKIFASAGQTIWMLQSATSLLRELKALLASTNRTASTSSEWKASVTE